MVHNLVELVASVALTGLLFVATHGAAVLPVPAAS
jgi:hypothetical protein